MNKSTPKMKARRQPPMPTLRALLTAAIHEQELLWGRIQILQASVSNVLDAIRVLRGETGEHMVTLNGDLDKIHKYIGELTTRFPVLGETPPLQCISWASWVSGPPVRCRKDYGHEGLHMDATRTIAWSDLGQVKRL